MLLTQTDQNCVLCTMDKTFKVNPFTYIMLFSRLKGCLRGTWGGGGVKSMVPFNVASSEPNLAARNSYMKANSLAGAVYTAPGS